MKITSTAFASQSKIPAEYTCDGRNVNPPLSFDGVPSGAASLALVMDDPDAPGGTWDHWVVWNLPASLSGIPAGEAPQGVIGRNSWKKNAWGGPCPPRGEHRYRFRLYALDTTLQLPPEAGKSELQNAMARHIVAEAELVGTYQRP